MALEQLNLVLQIVGSVGVVGSLIFVGLQVRQNTKATRVEVQENVTSNYIAVAQLLIDNVNVFIRGIFATREPSFEARAEKIIPALEFRAPSK